MAKRIVESMSVEEAFRALNKKSTYKIKEAIEDIDFNTLQFDIAGSDDVGEDAPYLYAYIKDTGDDLDTMIVGTVQNEKDGPFNSFDDIDIYWYSTEGNKPLEYNEPEIPENLKIKFVKEFNRYLGIKESKTVKKQNVIRESVDTELVKAIENQDEDAVVKSLSKYIKFRESDILEDIAIAEEDDENGLENWVYELVSVDYAIREFVPNLKEWWTIGIDSFGAAWNMLAVDTNNNVYGFFAETQGGPFVYGLCRVSTEGDNIDEDDIENFKSVLEDEFLSEPEYHIGKVSEDDWQISYSVANKACEYANNILGY